MTKNFLNSLFNLKYTVLIFKIKGYFNKDSNMDV